MMFLVPPMNRVIIGIDPDMRKCGVCAMSDGEIDVLMSVNTCELLIDLRNNDKGPIIAIEDVNQNAATYFRRGMGKQSIANRVSQNVGMVKAAATIIKDFAEMCSLEVILVPPGIGKQTKNNAALFATLTGFKGRTNEDMRDAYWIAHYADGLIKQREKNNG
jgi:hypothetical protein